MRVPSTLVLALVALVARPPAMGDEPDAPAVRDPRLRIALFACEPEIVTPTGIAVDGRGRVFVIESHTHTPDKDYPGPKDDRIKIFRDHDGDGRAGRVSIFAGGLREAMNLAFAPDGTLHVCHRAGVVALHDRDGDGVSESRTTVLTLETDQTYPHNCLLGLAFGPDGWLYVSRGNVGGYAYAIRGSDGTTLWGYGDGGNIVRCRADGSALEEVATGFWNPFDLDFDRAGRMLCVDNDPDSRGPNRLVHIIPGGDYGFRALYGPSGLHPYDAWDGELPGTLPMIDATGEAPSGVLDADRARLPTDYRGHILVTDWGAHAVARHRPERSGVSLRARREVLVEGGRTFRPVGIDAAPDGTIYITDWVEKDYPNHGKGRIWKLSTRPEIRAEEPRRPAARPEPDPGAERLGRLLAADSTDDFEALTAATASDDPFLRSAAITAMARPVFRPRVLQSLAANEPDVRLGALLALRRAKIDPPVDTLRACLGDRDERVRLVALMWIGAAGVATLADDLKAAVIGPETSARLLEAYLATVPLLGPEERRFRALETPGFSIRRRPGRDLVDALIRDASNPPHLRALALARVEQPDRTEIAGILTHLARGSDPLLSREAIRTLALGSGSEAATALIALARDSGAPASLRADAVMALARRPEGEQVRILELVDDPAPAVRIEAVRTLRPAVGNPAVRSRLAAKLESSRIAADGGEADPALTEQLRFALDRAGATASRGTSKQDRPRTDDEWMQAVAEGGDPEAGWRVFFQPGVNCVNCHRVGGRGGQIGPDLSAIGRGATCTTLLRSILEPSAEVAPQFQAYLVEREDGRILSGLQFHFRGNASISLLIEDGSEVRIPLAEVASYKASPQSLMPEGLEDQMTVGDLRNLLAFLLSLK